MATEQPTDSPSLDAPAPRRDGKLVVWVILAFFAGSAAGAWGLYQAFRPAVQTAAQGAEELRAMQRNAGALQGQALPESRGSSPMPLASSLQQLQSLAAPSAGGENASGSNMPAGLENVIAQAMENPEEAQAMAMKMIRTANEQMKANQEALNRMPAAQREQILQMMKTANELSAGIPPSQPAKKTSKKR